MTLHPEDLRYWIGWVVFWLVIFVAARVWLVNPVIRAIECLRK